MAQTDQTVPDRIAHRIPIPRLPEIDGEVKRRLREAYGLDA